MLSVKIIDGLPRFDPLINLNKLDTDTARINNRFLKKGEDTEFVPVVATGTAAVIFLEYVKHRKDVNLIIKDINDTTIMNVDTEDFDMRDAPVRFDGGVKFTGNIDYAIGFYMIVQA